MSDSCPECGANDLRTRTTIEHFRCGCVQPKTAFLDGDTYSCPECCSSDLPSTEYAEIGEFYTCCHCGATFDHLTADPGSAQVPPSAGEAEGRAREQDGQGNSGTTKASTPARIRAGLSSQRLIAVVLTILILSTALPVRTNTSSQPVGTEQNHYNTIVVVRNDDVQSASYWMNYGQRTASSSKPAFQLPIV